VAPVKRLCLASRGIGSADIELAKRIAGKRGLRYQTYVKMIIYQQLLKESANGAVISPVPLEQ